MAERPDIQHLRLAVKLAEEALLAGDDPFGSVLVDGDGRVLHQDRNRTKTGRDGDMRADATLHPEIELARWAQLNLGPEERAKTTVYSMPLLSVCPCPCH